MGGRRKEGNRGRQGGKEERKLERVDLRREIGEMREKGGQRGKGKDWWKT